jgi:hypothetical protein
MIFEYQPKPGQKLDPARCKATVAHGTRSPSFRQCERKVWGAGWCKQHHPVEVKKRNDQKQKEYDRIQNNRWALHEAEQRVIREAVRWYNGKGLTGRLRGAVRKLQKLRKM